MKQGFVVHHNGPNTNLEGKPHSACQSYWLGVKRYHVETKGWSDIAYSFGVCHHGELFVGRGWMKNQFANGADVVGVDDGADSEWYTVLVFLGWNDNASNPVDEEPTPEMVAGVRDLIANGRRSGRCGTRVLPHNAFKQKRCPGATFTALAREWDHAPLDAPDPEDDMPLNDADKEWLSDLVTKATGTRARINVADRSEVWRWTRETVIGVRALLKTAGDDVDEAAIAAAVLAGLDPAAIAAAIPADIAEKVADELASRLAG